MAHHGARRRSPSGATLRVPRPLRTTRSTGRSPGRTTLARPRQSRTATTQHRQFPRHERTARRHRLRLSGSRWRRTSSPTWEHRPEEAPRRVHPARRPRRPGRGHVRPGPAREALRVGRARTSRVRLLRAHARLLGHRRRPAARRDGHPETRRDTGTHPRHRTRRPRLHPRLTRHTGQPTPQRHVRRTRHDRQRLRHHPRRHPPTTHRMGK
ncbi:hypothetical protein Ae706Ps2_6695 [Pseudonocardia sp. Ae706_Ps2]|nr:hypothetical protein Ae706Ps2_6695 [Pseudonocardia sp. Ae706_Ps2]